MLLSHSLVDCSRSQSLCCGKNLQLELLRDRDWAKRDLRSCVQQTIGLRSSHVALDVRVAASSYNYTVDFS